MPNRNINRIIRATFLKRITVSIDREDSNEWFDIFAHTQSYSVKSFRRKPENGWVEAYLYSFRYPTRRDMQVLD